MLMSPLEGGACLFFMKIPGKKIEAEFEARVNRFVARVRLQKKSFEVHVPNSGRLAELLVPGARVILREAANSLRKYKYDLIMAYKNGLLVSVDSQLPNRLLMEAFNKKSPILMEHDRAKRLLKYPIAKPEISYKNSRFDIGLGDENDIRYYIEVKGVTLVENRRALFPDAPTDRGAKHLKELERARHEGLGAGVFFVIQREDAAAFSPNDSMDPPFGDALRRAARAGVDIFAFRCAVEPGEIKLIGPVDVRL